LRTPARRPRGPAARLVRCASEVAKAGTVRPVGIYGYYLRVTPEELKRALADDGWAREFVYDRCRSGGPLDERWLGVDKAWEGIFYVLAQAGLPHQLIDGRVLISPVDGEPPTPRYFDTDEVAAIARFLALQPFAELVVAAERETAPAARAYRPEGDWDDFYRDFITGHGVYLPEFFAEAAKAGDAVVLHLAF
jgi:hypothetical protein